MVIGARPDTTAPGQAWQALADARTAEQLCTAWLAVVCRELAPAESGVLLLAQDDGAFAPVAAHPAERDQRHLRDVATEALRTREAVLQPGDAGNPPRLALPMLLQEQLQGAVALEMPGASVPQLEQALRLMAWGTGWLLSLMHQRELSLARQRLGQGSFLIDSVLGALAERTPREAALNLVNRLAREFDSRQVHLALVRGHTLNVQALSHAAWFEARAGLLQQARDAMHEAYDQQRSILWPPPADATDPAVVRAAHARYAQACGAPALVSVPLLHLGQITGVLMLERDRPLAAQELAYLQTLAAAAAAALAVLADAQEGALWRAWRSARSAWQVVAGPRYPAWKLAGAVVAVALLVLGVVPAPFRIAAPAVVEGAIQRTVAAPFEGYVREAPVRAGDTVKAGQLMARLDDRDLLLERARWESELEVSLRKEREAMAAGNLVDQRLAGAQAGQARAQLDLALSRLERAQVLAPFDGTVVKGDWSQQLGAPLEQGKVLFEVAPLNAWRVMLKVDERDVAHVQVGAKGELLLASLPGKAWPFAVRKLTPVSVAEDGHNYFRVEAALADGAPRLSPNMEGVGKIEAGRASLLWIWTRPLREWLSLSVWKWLP